MLVEMYFYYDEIYKKSGDFLLNVVKNNEHW
jgi:hypothetical protein